MKRIDTTYLCTSDFDDTAYFQSGTRYCTCIEKPFSAFSKTADFALEYTCSDGVVCYTGLSVFQNTDQGIYAGNLICKDETVKLKRIGLSSSTLEQLVKLHIALLEQYVAPYYNGPLGIDCMVCGSAIQPFVEMNLRRTAGMLALGIEEHLSTTAAYHSHLEYFEDHDALTLRYNTLHSEYASDLILLAPLTPTSHYLHYLLPQLQGGNGFNIFENLLGLVCF